MSNTIDPITIEIIQNKLLTNVSQITHRLIRAGHSFMIKEMEDCSASLFDRNCRLLAESANIPIHLNCVGICLRAIIENCIPVSDWHEGDVVLTNDPYLGGSLGSAHTNDIIMYTPAFVDGELVGFAGVMAHHLDIGAMWMGSRGWNVEIYQEGLLIPPVKLAESGQMNSELFRLVLRNSRVPEALENDLLAQKSSLIAGCEELQTIYRAYGIETMETSVDQLVRYAEARSRQEISAIPDGTYRNEVQILDDGAEGGPYRLCVEILKEGSEITFDFTGTDKQMRGPVNAPLSTTMSTVYYAMRCLTDPSIPNSEGCKTPIRVIAPEGTLVNARPPAAVYQRMVTCHSLVDLIMGALADAVPERVIADSCGCQYNYVSSYDEQTKSWIGFGEVTAGGLGATADLDGIDVMACHVTNCAMPAIESSEIQAPVLFLRREYQTDSGGAGYRRGGVGQIVSYKVLASQSELQHTSQKAKVGARGFAGGLSGKSGRWVVNEGREDERALLYSLGDIERLKKDDTVTFYTTAGGGFGDPGKRERDRVQADLRDGFVSEKAAREIYDYDPGKTQSALAAVGD